MHLKYIFVFFLCLAIQALFSSAFSQQATFSQGGDIYKGAYTIKGDRFAIWNGKEYIPVFVKGINLGVSVPGTQPGQLAATREDYRRWFGLIKEAGYNTIRIYTLHYPRFYEEFAQYNLAHPGNPLLLLQGIWLEEQETATDLYDLAAGFDEGIRGSG